MRRSCRRTFSPHSFAARVQAMSNHDSSTVVLDTHEYESREQLAERSAAMDEARVVEALPAVLQPHTEPSVFPPLPSHRSPERVVVQRRVPAAVRAEATAIPPEGNRTTLYQAAKRASDLVGGLAALVLLSPVMLTTFVVLCVTTRCRPIFCQTRVGEGGRHFRMFKFRTMSLNADKMQCQVQNEKDGPIFKNRRDPRITRIGRFLRSTSIDEMPQLFNVLLGDMALVGPRPPVPKEVAKYDPWQRRRLAIKPGLTCLWQVSGRSEIGFCQWVRMDLWYLKHQVIVTDLKLMGKTPLAVLSRRGAY